MFEAEIREEARRQEKLKNLKTSDRREGKQLGKSEVMQYRGKKNARHEKVQNQHPVARPGWSGALISLRRFEAEEHGDSKCLLEALHAGMGKGQVKMRLG
jgi:hypothetical protein